MTNHTFAAAWLLFAFVNLCFFWVAEPHSVERGRLPHPVDDLLRHLRRVRDGMNADEPDTAYATNDAPYIPFPDQANVQPNRADRRALARQSQEYRDFRDANRSFRRAFGRGERHRKILLACGVAKLKEKS